MRRRTFSAAAAAIVGGVTLHGTALGQAARRAAASGPRMAPGLGTNLSGMEWAAAGLRYGASTLPNLNFTVPRRADVVWLADNGYGRNRLPISWELLQPVLHDTVASAPVLAALGRPGAFHAGYESYITAVLDAHAAVGSTCIIDCHNYCRYRDFKFQADGSVAGFTVPPDRLLRPYTTDNAQVQTRIFALAEGATLTQSHFADFWRRAAAKWKDHPGFGGYGLMNEPHDLPRPGEIVASEGGGEDLTIWPAYARAAIKAIRAVDPVNPIYVAGNAWSSASEMPRTPGFPLPGANLVYEVHLYLDAASNGHAFDWETERAKNFSAGIGQVAIDADTGVKRLQPAVEWARAKGVRLALTEIGMPIDDPRWQESFARTVAFARRHDVEVYSWMGGNHWASRNYAINHVPGWHQNRTLEPAVSGAMKASAGIDRGALFDAGPGWAGGGEAVTITVSARGSFARPVRLEVRADNGARLSKATLTIPAGANGSDSFVVTPARDRVTTLTYTAPGGVAPPPARRIHSLANPVAHARTNLAEAAMAIMARYGACQWDLADGYTDYLQGAPAGAGQPVRAIADSGFGSSVGNAMEMLNWVNTDSGAMGRMAPPVMRVTRGRKNADFSRPDTWGFWCRKSVPEPGVQPNPGNRVPYGPQDAHFALALVSLARADGGGVVFQASNARQAYKSELGFSQGRPQAGWIDSNGRKVELTSDAALAPDRTAVVAFTCAPGAQTLRVDATVAARATATLSPAAYDQFLIGWGFLNYYPRESFQGHIYAVITGKGAPSAEELQVLEAYLALKKVPA